MDKSKTVPLWKLTLAAWAPIVAVIILYGVVWGISYLTANQKLQDNQANCQKSLSGLASWSNCDQGAYIGRDKFKLPTYTTIN